MYYNLRAAASKRPDDMPVQSINIVHGQQEEVDDRGMDSSASTPVGLFLPLALASWGRSTRVIGPRSELLLAHQDDGAAVSLINATMVSEELRLSLHWVLSDTNHDVQGIASNQMYRIIVSFPKADGTGWVNIYTKLNMCTVIHSRTY